MTDFSVRHDLQDGDLGEIIALHGRMYGPLPKFGLRFEAFVAQTIAEYVLGANQNGRIWLAEKDGRLVGCTAIVLRSGKAAQLRWVLVDSAMRGGGLGRQLVEGSIEWSRERGCDHVFLETTDGLPESQALYEKLGFTLEREGVEELWDGPAALIRMRLELSG